MIYCGKKIFDFIKFHICFIIIIIIILIIVYIDFLVSQKK